jgi:hypothetical protein
MTWIGGLFSAVLWIGLIVVAVLLLRRELPHMRVERRSPALDLLEQRYARGEITRDEFLERRAVLLQHPASHGSGAAPPPANPPPAGRPPTPPAPPEPPPAPAGPPGPGPSA